VGGCPDTRTKGQFTSAQPDDNLIVSDTDNKKLGSESQHTLIPPSSGCVFLPIWVVTIKYVNTDEYQDVQEKSKGQAC
jgi:hypothetical protein